MKNGGHVTFNLKHFPDVAEIDHATLGRVASNLAGLRLFSPLGISQIGSTRLIKPKQNGESKEKR